MESEKKTRERTERKQRETDRGVKTSVLHEPARAEPDHGLEPARRMSEETRPARALRQGSCLADIGSWGKARAGSSLNLLIDPRYQMIKGRT